jgi:alkylation response protein AidB-like acyl-CoA dehydrogenase
MLVGESFLQAARDLAPEIILNRDEIERDRRIPGTLLERLRAAQMFELWLPRALGGPELHPIEYVRVIEALATADGSVAWCANVAGVQSLAAGRLGEDAAREIFGCHSIVVGSFSPSGTAVVEKGGFRVSGRWTFGSGINHSSWVVGNCVVNDSLTATLDTAAVVPETRFLFFPANAVEIIDTWNVSGLRGTGSHDFRVHDLFVPETHCTSAFHATAVQPGTLFQIPPHSLFAVGLAAVTMGIARAAIDAVSDLVHLPSRPSVHTALARAEALARAARAAVFEAIREQWAEVDAGDPPSMNARASIRLSCTYCAEACAKAVDLVYAAAGSSAVFESGRIARCFRDVHAARQHIGLSINNYEPAGRVLLGLDPETPRF